jgi:hypothetical protein
MAEYHEDGCVMDVTIMENNSDKERERYTLRVNRVLLPSGRFKAPESGKVIKVDKQRGVGYCGMWHLFN